MFKDMNNTMFSGKVYAAAKPEKGKDFGLSLVVILGDESFFVVKYASDKTNKVKSIKYWTGMSIDHYSKYNTKRDLVNKNESQMNLQEYLASCEKKNKPKGFYKDILRNTRDFVYVMEEDLKRIKFHSYYGDGKADDISKGVLVTRMAFSTNTDLNAVVKTFTGGSSDGVLSIKFDYTDIDTMSKEWNMSRIGKTDVANDFLKSLGDFLDESSIKEIEMDENNKNSTSKRKLYLISMLPGLGKSTIAKANSNVLDYEDWMEKGLRPYKTDKRPAEDIEKMIAEMTASGDKEGERFSNLYILSSIHWESMKADLKSDIFIHMRIGEYNCEEVTARGRKDLCDLIGNEMLVLWNEDYFKKIDDNNSLVLGKESYLSIELLNDFSKNTLGYDVLGEEDEKDELPSQTVEEGGDEIVHDDEEEILIDKDDIEVDEEVSFDFSDISKDKLFKFKDVDNQYYIIEDRAVIVFQFKLSNTYAYWDILGKEDHRVIISAKGPFDDELEVITGKKWLDFRYDKASFIEKIGMSQEDVIKLFANYSTDWAENARQMQIFMKYVKPKAFK